MTDAECFAINLITFQQHHPQGKNDFCCLNDTCTASANQNCCGDNINRYNMNRYNKCSCRRNE